MKLVEIYVPYRRRRIQILTLRPHICSGLDFICHGARCTHHVIIVTTRNVVYQHLGSVLHFISQTIESRFSRRVRPHGKSKREPFCDCDYTVVCDKSWPGKSSGNGWQESRAHFGGRHAKYAYKCR